jgi:hypothetical protein
VERKRPARNQLRPWRGPEGEEAGEEVKETVLPAAVLGAENRGRHRNRRGVRAALKHVQRVAVNQLVGGRIHQEAEVSQKVHTDDRKLYRSQQI